VVHRRPSELEVTVGAITVAGIWRTTAPREDVYAVLADLDTWPRWWPAIRDVEVLGEDAARLTFGTPAPLRPLVVEVDVDATPHERLSLTPREGPVAGSGALVVREEDDATAVDYELQLAFRSRLLRPLERVMANATKDAGAARLRKAGDELAALAGGEPGRHEP
jgi:uncharacterized membrane protein